MDFPIHVAAGALAGSVLLYLHARERHISGDLTLTRSDTFELGATGCFLGILTHLLLDAFPYYDYLFRIEIFKHLPYGWTIPTALLTVPVIIVAIYLNKDARLIVELSMFGGMYPDMEKLAYFDAHLPRSFVLFPYHSCQLSGSPWEFSHARELIVMEIGVFAIMMRMICWLAAERKRARLSLCQTT